MAVSFELTEDQIELQKWVHEFAATVVRPAAAQYDEREDFPWPVLQEAAKIGLYSLDFFATQWFDESGLGIPLTMEELFWGDAGIGLAIVGTTLAAASVRANGTDEQVGQWIPAMFGTVDEPKVAAFCSSEPDAGSDVGAMRTRAVYDEKTDEWVLTGTKTWATNGGIADIHVVTAVVDPELKARGHASFVVPPGTKGSRRARSFSSTASAPRTPRRSSSTTAAFPVTASSAAATSSRNAWPAPAKGRRAGGPSRPWPRSSGPVPPSGRKRSGSPGPRTTTRWSTPSSGCSSAGRSSRTRPSHSCSPT
jgi:hypothetical protein